MGRQKKSAVKTEEGVQDKVRANGNKNETKISHGKKGEKCSNAPQKEKVQDSGA